MHRSSLQLSTSSPFQTSGVEDHRVERFHRAQVICDWNLRLTHSGKLRLLPAEEIHLTRFDPPILKPMLRLPEHLNDNDLRELDLQLCHVRAPESGSFIPFCG
jgi:hypothetical protein